MDTISARQLIYSRVEAKYSPVGKGGFQTVYASKELSRQSVETIEGYVRVFDVSDPAIRRRQFFAIDPNQIVVTQTLGLTGSREILDSTGGGGVFLAHCLVFSRNEFSQIESNPFWVFDHFTFLSDPEEMVKNYHQASGKEPLVSIEVRTDYPECSPECIKIAPKLIALFDSVTKAPQDARIQFVGSPNQIEDCLRTLILFIHPSKRIQCGFDTHAVRISADAKQIRLVGLPKEKPGFLVTFNIERQTIVPPINSSGDKDLFTQWLSKSNFNPDNLIHLNTFQELNRAYTDKSWPMIDQLSEEGCAEFIRVFPDPVKKGVSDALTKAISREFAEVFTNFFISRKKSKIYVAAVATSRKIDLTQLRDEVRLWVLEKAAQFTWDKKYQNDLRTIAKATTDQVLWFWAAALNDETKKADAVLEIMSVDDYRQALSMLHQPLSVQYFLHPRFIKILSQFLAESIDKIPEEELFDIIQISIDNEMFLVLEVISPRILTVDNRLLARIEKMIGKEKFLAPKFMRNMQERRRVLGAPPSFLDIFSRK